MPDPDRHALAVEVCDNVALAMMLVRRGAGAAVSSALGARCGLELPLAGRLATAGATSLLWSGPDRFLAIRQDGGPGLAQELEAGVRGLAHVVEASSSRLVLTVSGEAASEALNRLLPIDLHPRVFTCGAVALTVASHIGVQVWRPGEDMSFGLACASSFGASFKRQLSLAGIADH